MAGSLISNRDECYQALLTAWTNAPGGTGIDGPFFPLLYGTLEQDGIPDDPSPGSLPWARASVTHDSGRATSISARVYEVTGVVRLQIFASVERSRANTIVQTIADYIVTELRGHEGNVLLKDVSARDVLGDNGFKRTDVLATLLYQDHRKRPGQSDGTAPDPGTDPVPPIGGTEPLVFHKTVPAILWTVNHGLGYRPSVETLDAGGNEIIAAVRHVSENQFTVEFDTPTAGMALYR